MKMITKSVVVAGVTMLAVTTMLGKGKGSGQPVHTIRFTFKAIFTNTGADPSVAHASGTAAASESQNVANNTDRESLTVSLKGLTAGAPYSLFATDNGTSIDAADFTAGKNGDAKLSLTTTPGKKGIALGSLDPLTGVTELDIVEDAGTNSPSTNTSTTILTTDTTAPKSYTFMDKEAETSTNDAGAGTLTISASNKSSKLSLTATGLGDSQQYLLDIDGTGTTNTYTSTSKGDLRISAPLTSNVLDLTSVELTDTSDDVILLFPLP